MQYYLNVLIALENYFQIKNWKNLFLQGGCYWLADILQKGISDSFLMINRMQEHCAVFFESSLYDITGRISKKIFAELLTEILVL